ncbi:MAG: DUF6090 family protein [Cyclobacteriaceae bacterium]
MQKNKYSTYLLYAVGEIFLVVIGILIAVSIDDWNASRKNTLEASFQLAKVKDDLESDQIRLDRATAHNEVYIQSLSLCMKVLANDTLISKEEFLRNFQYMTSTNTFEPARGAFEGLISSAKIQLISNKELLRVLIPYYSHTDAWNTAIVDFSRNVITPYLLFFDHTPNITGSGPFEFTQYDLSKFSIPGKTIEDYRMDQFIVNATRLKIELFEGQQVAFKGKQEQISTLLDQLGREIK